jgi:hypothetical protein
MTIRLVDLAVQRAVAADDDRQALSMYVGRLISDAEALGDDILTPTRNGSELEAVTPPQFLQCCLFDLPSVVILGYWGTSALSVWLSFVLLCHSDRSTAELAACRP